MAAPLDPSQIRGRRLADLFAPQREAQEARDEQRDREQRLVNEAAENRREAAQRELDERRERRQDRQEAATKAAEAVEDSAVERFARRTGRDTYIDATGRQRLGEESAFAAEQKAAEEKRLADAKEARRKQWEAKKAERVAAAKLEADTEAHALRDPAMKGMTDSDRSKLEGEVEKARLTTLAALTPELEARIRAKYADDDAAAESAIAGLRAGQVDPGLVAEVEREKPELFAGERQARARLAEDDKIRARRSEIEQRAYEATGRVLELEKRDPLLFDEAVSPDAPRDAFDEASRVKALRDQQAGLAKRAEDIDTRARSTQQQTEQAIAAVEAEFQAAIQGRMSMADFQRLRAGRTAKILELQAANEESLRQIAEERVGLAVDMEDWTRRNALLQAAPRATQTAAPAAPAAPPAEKPVTPARDIAPPAAGATTTAIRTAMLPTEDGEREVALITDFRAGLPAALDQAGDRDVYVAPDFTRPDQPFTQEQTAAALAPLPETEIARQVDRAEQLAASVTEAVSLEAAGLVEAVAAGLMEEDAARAAYPDRAAEAAERPATVATQRGGLEQIDQAGTELNRMANDAMGAFFTGRMSYRQLDRVMQAVGVSQPTADLVAAAGVRAQDYGAAEKEMTDAYASAVPRRVGFWEGVLRKAKEEQQRPMGERLTRGALAAGVAGLIGQVSPAVKDALDPERQAAAAAQRVADIQRQLDETLTAREAATAAIATKYGLSDDETAAMRARASRDAVLADPRGFVDALAEIAANPEAKLPFVGDLVGLAVEHGPVIQAAMRVRNGEELTPTDEAILEGYIEDAGRDSAMLAQVVDVVSQLPAFGVEIATTGGIGSMARKGSAKAATAVVGKEVAAAVAKWAAKRGVVARGIGRGAAAIASTTAQTPFAMADKIAADTIRATQIPDLAEFDGDVREWIGKPGKAFGPAATAAFFDAWAEMVSEASGGAIAGAGKLIVQGGKTLMPSVTERVMRSGFARALAKVNGTKPVAALSRLARRGQFHGSFTEMLEERVGDAIRATGHELTGGAVGEQWEWPTAEQWAVEALAFTVPNAAFTVINTRAARRAKRDIRANLDAALEPVRAMGMWSDRASVAEGINRLAAAAQMQAGGAPPMPLAETDIAAIEDLVGPLRDLPEVRRIRTLGDRLDRSMIDAERIDDIDRLGKLANVRAAGTLVQAGRAANSVLAYREVAQLAARDAAGDADARFNAARLTGAAKIGAGRPRTELTEAEAAALAAPLASGEMPVAEVNGRLLVTDAGRADLAAVYGPVVEAVLPMSESKARRRMGGAAPSPATPASQPATPAPSTGQPSPAPSGDQTAPPSADWTGQGMRGTTVTLPAAEARTEAEAQAKLANLLPLGELLNPDTVRGGAPATRAESGVFGGFSPDQAEAGDPATTEPGSPTPDPGAETAPADRPAQTKADAPDPASSLREAARQAAASSAIPKSRRALAERRAMVMLDVLEGLNATGVFPGGVEFVTQGIFVAQYFPRKGVMQVNVKGLASTDLDGTGDAFAAAVAAEEVIHAVATQVLDGAAVEAMWQALPADLQATVSRAYDAAAEANNTAAPARDAYTMGHEFIRMVVQDRAFRGLVTEAMDVETSWVGDLRDFLARLLETLRDMISRLDGPALDAVESAADRVMQAMQEIGIRIDEQAARRPAPAASDTPEGRADEIVEAIMGEGEAGGTAPADSPSPPESSPVSTDSGDGGEAVPEVLFTQGDWVKWTSANGKDSLSGQLLISPSNDGKTARLAIRTATGSEFPVIGGRFEATEAPKAKKKRAPRQPKAKAPWPDPAQFETGKWNAYVQKEYSKLKSALTKAINAEDWNAVLDEKARFESFFDVVGAYPDDWNRWENAADDARLALARKTDTFLKPLVPPATQSEGDRLMADAFEGLFAAMRARPPLSESDARKLANLKRARARQGQSGRETTRIDAKIAEIERAAGLPLSTANRVNQAGTRVAIPQEGLPADRLGKFVTAAQALIAEGVRTPEALAERMDRLAPNGALRRYSQAFWDAFGMVDPTLRGTHDWDAVYGGEAEGESPTFEDSLTVDPAAGDALPAPETPDPIKFIGDLEAGEMLVSRQVIVRGNFNRKKDAEALAASLSKGSVEPYLNGKYKTGWVVLQPADETLSDRRPDPVESETLAPGSGEPPQETDGLGAKSLRLAEILAERIRRKEKTSIQQLSGLAAEVFGGATGAGFDIKTAYDAVEMAINTLVLDSRILVDASSWEAAKNLETIREWLEYIPTQTRRTGEMDALQQFSTPPHFAYIAAWVAGVNSRDVGLEPSAGLGGLASFMARAGADVILNELSDRRRQMLDALRIGRPATGYDAGLLHAILLPAINSGAIPMPTVVVMNPPFSNSAAGRKDLLTGGYHIEEALKLLAPGGRLVAIVGEGMSMSAPRYRDWWRKVESRYSVRANIHVDGREYTKYGTSFSNRILVIDKIAPTGEPIVQSEVKTIEELIPLLEPVRLTRPESNERGLPDNSPPSDQSGGINENAEGVADTGDVSGSADPGTGSARPGQRGGRSRGGRAGARGGGRKADGGSDAPLGGSSDAATGGNIRTEAAGRQDTGGTQGAVGSDLTSETGEAEKAEIDANEIFSEYRPRKVRIKGAQPHPSSLVESSSMASVELPDNSILPNIPADVVADGAISSAQLEAVAYAALAHETVFEDGRRQGFFIGDGTGVGKGREIAGVIFHNWREGRKKAVWISEKRGLYEDAGRDFRGIGAADVPLIDMASKIATPEGNGVAFLTYDSLKENFAGLGEDGRPVKLKADKPSRAVALLEWLGKDFDGVIALDEAHNAGNLLEVKKGRGTSKPSAAALAVNNLQLMFPNARVVYASATGATEPQNVAFADRLGLWGLGKAFTDARSFYETIRSAGISAMEIFARDLKSMGLYMARTLSFKGKDGDAVEFERLEHALTPDQEEIYRRAAEGWQTIFTNIDAALNATGAQNNSMARSVAMSALFGSQQRFFNNLLTSLQMPTVLADMQRRLDEGGSIVVQLVNTNESALDRALVRALAENPDNPNLEGLDLSNRQDMLEYINTSFPVQQFVEKPTGQFKADGTPITVWVPLTVKDADGKEVAVLNPEAVERRDALLQSIATIQMPDPPIEQIINFFGHENVAEITGRKKRVINAKDEKGNMRRQIESKRSDARLRIEKDEFLDGKRRVLIFSNKGGTGFSYHAGKTFKNQQRRYQYVIQPGWRADKAIQGLGRTHRADQVRSPFFILAGTNVRGHQRFISTIARRLQQLGALTSGERKSTGQGLFRDDDNIHDEYGENAVVMFFRDLHRNKIPGLNFLETTARLGYVKTVNDEQRSTLLDDTGSLNQDKLPGIDQFLNRILALPIAEQNLVYDSFMERRARFIERARENGTYDVGVESFPAPEAEIIVDETVYESAENSSKTRLVEIEYKKFHFLRDFDSVPDDARFFQNRRTGKIFAYTPPTGTTRTLEDGRVVSSVTKIGVRDYEYVGENEITDDGKSGPRPGKASVGDEFDMLENRFKIVEIVEPEGSTGRRVRVQRANGDGNEFFADTKYMRALYEQTGKVVEGVSDNANFLPANYPLGRKEAKALWDAEFADHPKFESKRATFVVGTILPVWHRIPKFYKKVKRVELADGSSFLGVEVPDDSIAETRSQLGAAAAEITPGSALSAILDSRASVKLSNGWSANYVLSAGESRIEIVGPPPDDWSTRWGTQTKWEAYYDGFMERINYRPRFFLNPTLSAMDKLFRTAPPMEVVYPEGQTLSAADRVNQAAAETDTDPSDAQKEAGNYRKGKADILGLRVSIENPAGSTRSGTDASGKPWSVTMAHHYGYFLGSEGKDGDHVDTFIQPGPALTETGTAYVVNQKKGNGQFDEHKVMLGFSSPTAAAQGYRANYSPGWKGLGSIVPLSVPALRHWLATGDTTVPLTRAAAAKLEQDAPRPASPMPPRRLSDLPAGTVSVMWNGRLGTLTTRPGSQPLQAAARAYHGTPHRIGPEGFKLDRIGTGEGNQSYGWGLYFAEAFRVADSYRFAGDHPEALAAKAAQVIRTKGPSSNWMGQPMSTKASNKKHAKAYGKAIDVAPDRILKYLADPDLKPGNLYTVEIDAEPDAFLQWDKPLSQQSERVQAAFLQAYAAHSRQNPDAIRFAWDISGLEMYDMLAGGGRQSSGREAESAMRKASQALFSVGIVGIRYLDGNSRDGGSGTYNYVIFDESVIRIVAENDQPVERPLQAAQRAYLAEAMVEPGFYSTLILTALNKLPARFSPAQALATLTGTPGVKAEEIKWSGLRDALARMGQEGGGTITKDALIDYLEADGAVVLEEFVNGAPRRSQWSAVRFSSLTPDQRQRVAGSDMADPDDWVVMQAGEPLFNVGSAPNEAAALDIYDESANDAGGENTDGQRFVEYQLPGGTNYREIVLAMPPKPADIEADARKMATIPWDEMTDEARQNVREIAKTLANRYVSENHFPNVPNYVAHLRVNDRPDPSGAPGLFIEEIQSDRHQQGREKGYREDEQAPFYVYQQTAEGFVPVRYETREQAALENPGATIGDSRESGNAIPDAPFRKDWPLQLFKRALRDAVASGKEWIGWTTGETQADRYALSKQISVVEWAGKSDAVTKQDLPEKSVDLSLKDLSGEIWLNVDIAGAILSAKGSGDGQQIASQLTGKNLVDAVGKPMADKILAESKGKVFGADLDIGGEGMKGFYDSILPKEIGKYVRQWGATVEKAEIITDPGTKPGTVRIPGDTNVRAERREPIWRVTITDAMRDGVEAGQPLFAANRVRQSPVTPEQDAAYLAAVKAGDMETAQRMVDNAAKAAGYDVGPVYHGTDADFDVFSKIHSLYWENEKGYFFTDKNSAQTYAETASEINYQNSFNPVTKTRIRRRPRVVEAYLQMNAPEVIETDYEDPDQYIDSNAIEGDAIVNGSKGTTFIVTNPNQIKSADPVTYDDQGNVIPLSQRFNPASDSILYAAPRTRGTGPGTPEDHEAIRAAIEWITRKKLPPAGEMDAIREQAIREPEGERTIGNPEIANYAEEDYVRREIDAVRHAYEQSFQSESHEEWEASARAMVKRDPDGVMRDLVEAAREGRAIESPEMVKAAQLLIPRMIRHALAIGDKKSLREAQAVAMAYAMLGTEQGRALAARRDPFKTPAERHTEFFARILAKVPDAVMKRADKAPKPAEKARRIDTLKRRIAELEAVQTVPRAEYDAATAELATVRAELARVQRQKDRSEILEDAHRRRLEAVEQALASMGVTLHDIFSHQAVVRLRGSEIVARVIEDNFSQPQRQALRMMLHDGASPRQIKNETGIAIADVKALRDRFRTVMRARILELTRRGLSLRDFEATDEGMFDISRRIDTDGTVLRSAPRGPEDAMDPEAAADEIMKALMGDDAAWEAGRMRRPGKRRSRARGTAPATGPAEPAEEEPGNRFDIENRTHVAQAARLVQAAVDSNAFDMVYEYWINNILSGPQTHSVNITGNALNIAFEYGMQRWMEAAWNAVVREPGGAQLGEYKWLAKMLPTAWAPALEHARLAWATEESFFEADVLRDPSQIGEPIDKLGGSGKRAAIPGQIGRIIRIPGRALLFMDTLFKAVVGYMEVGAQAYRIAKSEGLAGAAMDSRIRSLVNLPGSAAWIGAVEKAREMTFTTPLRAHKDGGGTAESIVKLIQDNRQNKALIGNAGAFVLGWVFPFIQTPFNIFRIGLRRTPLGLGGIAAQLLRAGFYAWRPDVDKRQPFRENYPNSRLIRDLTDQTIAWLATSLLWAITEGDPDDDEKRILITGGRPFGVTREGERSLLDRTEGGSFQIRFGKRGPGAIYLDYGRLEPMATTLASVVDGLRSLKRFRAGSDGREEIGRLFAFAMDQAKEKTFLNGFEKIHSALAGDAPLVGLRDVIQGIVPNIIRQPLRNLDDFVRNYQTAPWYYHALPIGGFAEPRYDLYGDPIRKAGTPLEGMLGEDFDRPLRIIADTGLRPKAYRPPADSALVAWNRANPQETYFPSRNSITTYTDALGERQTLTREQIAAVEKQGGRRFGLETGMGIPLAETIAPTADTRGLIQRVRGNAFEDARDAVVQQPVPPPRKTADVRGRSLRELLGAGVE